VKGEKQAKFKEGQGEKGKGEGGNQRRLNLDALRAAKLRLRQVAANQSADRSAHSKELYFLRELTVKPIGLTRAGGGDIN
jgi:hypothetical protein